VVIKTGKDVTMMKHDAQKTQDIEGFDPNPKVVSKIIKILFEQGRIGRTTLSLRTKINYQALSKHVMWLQKNGHIEFEIVEGKLLIGLTDNGREFARKLATLPY
jgi:predicted transcriptional regulator